MDNQPPKPANTSIPVIILSLLLGATAGGLAGYGAALKTAPTTTLTNGTRVASLSVREESETVAVVAKALPAAVTVVATRDLSTLQRSSPFDFFYYDFNTPNGGSQEVSSGAGFIVEPDGLIVTNKHVVSDEQAQYSVITQDGQSYDATVVARDPSNDVALLKIEATGLTTLELGDSDQVVIGQTVIAIGNPLEFENSVTKGIISGTSRTITASDGLGQAETLEDVFQTDAAINSGNSGGPLLNLAGQVIAINTAVSQAGQSIGFAIPSNVISKDISSYQTAGKIVQAYLGVRYVSLTPDISAENDLAVGHGAWLRVGGDNEPAVLPDSPAASAGLKTGDIILEVNGQAINHDRTLSGLLSQFNPGEEIELKILREDKEQTLTATLGERE